MLAKSYKLCVPTFYTLTYRIASIKTGSSGFWVVNAGRFFEGWQARGHDFKFEIFRVAQAIGLALDDADFGEGPLSPFKVPRE